MTDSKGNDMTPPQPSQPLTFVGSIKATVHNSKRLWTSKSWEEAKQNLAVKDVDGNVASVWINQDIRPLPPSVRLWGWESYGAYNFGINVLYIGWASAATFLTLGMTVWQAILVVVIGQFIVASVGTLGANIGARSHVGFPVLNRLSWGMRANWFPIMNRVFLGMAWFAVESWYGGVMMKVALGAIWPSLYTMHNPFPKDLGMDGGDFLCWCLFLLLCIPLIYWRLEKLFWPSMVTSTSIVLSIICMLGYFVNKAGGAGRLIHDPASFTGIPRIHGSALAWAMLFGITTSISSKMQGILGYADWGRYAKTPAHCTTPFFLGMYLGQIFIACTGLVISSAASTVYPEVEKIMTTPQAVLLQLQAHGGGRARAAVFFLAVPWVLSQYLLTISACNMIGGLDMAGIFPKWLTIRRGAFVVFAIGIVMQPWSLLNGSSAFLTTMSSFGVFLAPLTGIIHFDYYAYRRGKIALSQLYEPSARSSLWYWHGINWRAIVAFIIGQGPLWPGFIARVRHTSYGVGWDRIYNLTFIYGYFVSGLVYWGLSVALPARIPSDLPQVGQRDAYDIYGTWGPAELDPDGKIWDQQLYPNGPGSAGAQIADAIQEDEDEDLKKRPLGENIAIHAVEQTKA